MAPSAMSRTTWTNVTAYSTRSAGALNAPHRVHCSLINCAHEEYDELTGYSASASLQFELLQVHSPVEAISVGIPAFGYSTG